VIGEGGAGGASASRLSPTPVDVLSTVVYTCQPKPVPRFLWRDASKRRQRAGTENHRADLLQLGVVSIWCCLNPPEGNALVTGPGGQHLRERLAEQFNRAQGVERIGAA